MLEKMGWKSGEGLGRHGQGALEPTQATVRPERLGLGGQRSLTEELGLKHRGTARRKDALELTRARFALLEEQEEEQEQQTPGQDGGERMGGSLQWHLQQAEAQQRDRESESEQQR